MGTITFQTDNARLQQRFEEAVTGLAANVVPVFGYDNPVLVEGSQYLGIWLECGPLEGAVYRMIDPQVALDNHRIFFKRQQDDGYLPCWIRRPGIEWVYTEETGTAQIQMVTPIAATAFEVFEETGDIEFLEEAYGACVRWDAWLAQYRDTRGTGLCELFCEFDTGHDNSPRLTGVPRECPDRDARVCNDFPGLPYLAPDLSATVYGGRVALAKMAAKLGREAESLVWARKADETRRALLAQCFDAESQCFYDLTSDHRWVRVRGDVVSRVFEQHVPDQALFDQIYHRYFKDPAAFWTPYPLPSIAANDPVFDSAFHANSWGGPAQALTALRAPRWFEHYGKVADLGHLMGRWLDALTRSDGFYQQMNPWTGEFTPAPGGYSPAMLVMLDYTARLHGVRKQQNHLIWACTLPPDATWSSYTLTYATGTATVVTDQKQSRLFLDDRLITTVHGQARLTTDLTGRHLSESDLPMGLEIPCF